MRLENWLRDLAALEVSGIQQAEENGGRGEVRS